MINKVILVGKLGKDPIKTTLQGGNAVTKFSMATSENYKDKNGEWQEITEWHNIVCWGKLADSAEKRRKGETVYVEGKITTRKWQNKEGADQYTTEVVANMIRNLSPKKPEGISPNQAHPQNSYMPPIQNREADYDEDLPF